MSAAIQLRADSEADTHNAPVIRRWNNGEPRRIATARLISQRLAANQSLAESAIDINHAKDKPLALWLPGKQKIRVNKLKA